MEWSPSVILTLRLICSGLLPMLQCFFVCMVPTLSLADEPAATISNDQLPIASISQVHSHARKSGDLRQVHVQGIVSHVMSDSSFFMSDDTGGIYAFYKPLPPFQVGQRVEVTGHLSLSGYSAILENCTVVSLGMETPPKPVVTTPSEVLSGKHDLQLITLRGYLSAQRLRRGGVLVLRDVDSEITFTADLEAIPRSQFAPFDQLEADSVLAVTGACMVIAGGDGTPRSINLFLRSFEDIKVVSGPPWWNRERSQALLLLTAIALALFVAWSVSLRRHVKRNTQAIQNQLQRERLLESRYRAMFEGNPHPMWVYDQVTLRFLAVNETAITHYGWSRDEFLQMKTGDIRSDETVLASGQNVSQTAGSLKTHEIQRHRKKYGEPIDVEVVSHSMEFDGRPAVVELATDVTERLRAEGELRASQRQFATVFASNPDAIMIARAQDGQIVSVNPAFEQLFEWPAEEVIGKTSKELGLWAEPEKRGPAIAELLENGTVRNLESRLKTKSGLVLFGLSSAEVITYDGHLCMLSLTRDITDRKRADDALRHREASLAAAQHIASLGSWESDMQSLDASGLHPLSWSDEVYRIFGYEPRTVDVTEAFFFDHIHPDDREIVRDAVKKAFEEHSVYELEHRIIRPDGTIREVHEYSEITFDQTTGEPVRMLGVIKDITVQKQSEAALKEARERLDAVLSSLEEALWSTTVDGREVLYSNPAVEKIYGCSMSQFNPFVGGSIDQVIAEDQGRVASLPHRLQQVDSISEEIRIQRIDQMPVWLRIRVRLMRDAAGNALRIDGVTTDITGLKAADEERRRLEEQLQQTQKMDSLGILAGGIAHDFNNLLTAVIGYLTLSRMELAPASPVHRFLVEAEKASQRAGDLARQMLAYSGRGKFVAQRVDLREVFEEMNQILRVSISRDVEICFKHAPRVPAIEVDVTQLRQIVLNLVMNASDAIGGNGGVITISTGVMECTQEFLASTWLKTPLPSGKYCFLQIEDNGCGIEQDKLASIFDPFFTTKFTGRGLGLSAVLGIVRGHRGAIEVRSERGKGTSFNVLFPASQQSAQPLVSSTLPATGAWQGQGLVLLVDDDASILQVGQQMLERIGFEVITACDGWEAVRIFKERFQEIELVILDLTMPNLDGHATFGELRKIRIDAPVVLSSGYTEQDVMERSSGSAFAGFVPKPYSLKNLKSVLQSVLQNSEPPAAARIDSSRAYLPDAG